LNRGALVALLVSVFLVSFSMLAFEITLARLLSVLILYHYVFAIVSLALLGLGLGGLYVYFFRPAVPVNNVRFSSLALVASLIALAIPLSAVLMTRIGYLDSVINNILFYCFLLFIPFFFTGVFLAQAFQTFPGISSRIYGADLVGAAIGSLGIIFFLDVLGALNTSFFLGVTAAAGAVLLMIPTGKQKIWRMTGAIACLVLVVILLVTNLSIGYLTDVPVVGNNPGKEIYHALHNPTAPGRIIETRWSAFGRTDLVEYPEYPYLMELYLDGTSSAPMYQFSGDFANPESPIDSLKTDFTGYFPFFFLQPEEKDSALIIGPGGGRDVVLALMGGVAQITAVEVNRDTVDIVREYSDYNGGIYTDFPNVNVVVDEGRNFLKRQQEDYDLIMLSLPVTQTSRSLEGFSLTENFLFTVESIQDYLSHLTDEGRLLVITHDDFTAWRLLSVSLEALNEQGVNDREAFQQIAMFGLSSEQNVFPVFELKKTPFEAEESAARLEKLVELGHDPLLAYFPHIDDEEKVNPTLKAIADGKLDFDRVLDEGQQMGLDLRPVTDNRPFFYKIESGLPQPVTMVFWASAIMLIAVLLGPPLYRRWRSPEKETREKGRARPGHSTVRHVGLFTLLGVGFMLIEISLIQRFVLYLGQPVLSMAVLLFSLLVGAGLGSLYSGRLAPGRLRRGIALAALGIAAVVVAYAFLVPFLFESLLGLALAARLLAMLLLIVPLGFIMGFPFPLGIRSLQLTIGEQHIPWMWGINGAGSVSGSVLTIVIAIGMGFTQALLAGALCYLGAFALFRK